jgi:hypothetical protein
MGTAKQWVDITTTHNKEKDTSAATSKLQLYGGSAVLSCDKAEVDFGSMQSEDECLKDLVKGLQFESGTRDVTEPGEKVYDKQNTWPRNLHIHTHKPIPPAKVGGPYLCDSDSDVTAVPIMMVEDLDMVEDSDD